MSSWARLLQDLAGMPDALDEALRQVPADRLDWLPESLGGAPGHEQSLGIAQWWADHPPGSPSARGQR